MKITGRLYNSKGHYWMLSLLIPGPLNTFGTVEGILNGTLSLLGFNFFVEEIHEDLRTIYPNRLCFRLDDGKFILMDDRDTDTIEAFRKWLMTECPIIPKTLLGRL